MVERFAYDEVPYDTEANTEAHPRSMATLGRLFGIPTSAPSGARVLEIGCGDGEHLIAAASYLPGARFVGFDLSAAAIARGQRTAAEIGATNVELLHRDVREVRAADDLGRFDYVIAHGVYSWVPDAVRGDVLAVLRSALAEAGIGFLSMNALPGWELRRALRVLMREAASAAADPGAKVAAALALVDDLAGASGDGFVAVLAQAAAEYRAHVTQATPPDAPFSHYVFHDLLAECNEPFAVADLERHLRAHGLRIVCETPLLRERATDPPSEATDVRWLAARMAESGSPFLQVLVCRDDAAIDEPTTARAVAAVRDLYLWADLAPVDARSFRTTTGAVLRATGDGGLARAARSAPRFVAVRSLADDEASLADLARDLLVSSCEGLLTLASEPPAIAGRSPSPSVTAHVRYRAGVAAAAQAPSTVLTSALHRSFRVPWAELVVIRELDGATDEHELRARVRSALAGGPAELTGRQLAGAGERAVAEHVEAVLDRFARYGFLVAAAEVRR
ncbi:MAG TPA: class I SAM-dependent methyltransferase [Labilithrix sp.]|nr:class I SAM-dependent methyltransferase [Labilithrix sp.]